MTIERVPAGDIRVGDLIRFLNEWHRVSSLDERTAAGHPVAGAADGHPVARAADGWGITLEPNAELEVDR